MYGKDFLGNVLVEFSQLLNALQQWASNLLIKGQS